MVAVIALLLVYYYAIYEDGSLKVKDNALVNVEENWLVGQRSGGKNSRYYHFADVQLPEGYETTDGTTSGLVQSFTGEKDGVRLSITPVGSSVQDMISNVYGTITAFVGENGTVSAVQDADTKLGAAKYFVYTNSMDAEDGSKQYSKSTVLYAPANYSDSCILISTYAPADSEEALPADDALLAEVYKAIDGIVLAEK